MNNDFYEEYHENNAVESESFAVADVALSLVKVFLWMFVGVTLSFLTAWAIQKILVYAILKENTTIVSLFMVAMVVSFIIEFFLCYRISKNASNALTTKKAFSGFIFYSILNGISLSTLFFVLDASALYQVLAAVAAYFLILAGFTALFRKKMTTLWAFAGVGLLSLLVASALVALYSLFFFTTLNADTSMYLYLGVSIFGLIVFSIMTIADVNRIKTVLIEDTTNHNGAIISGAFILYLDFINILLYVIRILILVGGKGRKK